MSSRMMDAWVETSRAETGSARTTNHGRKAGSDAARAALGPRHPEEPQRAREALRDPLHGIERRVGMLEHDLGHSPERLLLHHLGTWVPVGEGHGASGRGQGARG